MDVSEACYVMLCYVMVCYVMLCYAMLCYVILCICYAMLCHAMLCHAMPCHAMLCYAMICYAMLCYAMLCYAMLLRSCITCAPDCQIRLNLVPVKQLDIVVKLVLPFELLIYVIFERVVHAGIYQLADRLFLNTLSRSSAFRLRLPALLTILFSLQDCGGIVHWTRSPFL